MNINSEAEQSAYAKVSCGGGPAPTTADACCVADAEAKAAGNDGCGCRHDSGEVIKKSVNSCC